MKDGAFQELVTSIRQAGRIRRGQLMASRISPPGGQRETDRAFAAAAAAGQMDSVFSFWTDDAAIYPAGMPVVRGKDAIREFVARNRAQPGFAMKWEPREAVVSHDGSLGYTVGDYEVTIDGADGGVLTRRGRYLETWQRDETGSWKCTVEIQAPLGDPVGPDVRPGGAGR